MADILSGINTISSNGTVIAAVLETVGFHVQSLFLDQLDSSFGRKFGAFLYIIGIIGALITIASGGSYRYGLWLLIGPPLYFFLVTVRSPAQQTEWRFGSKTYSDTDVKKGLQEIVPQGNVGEVSSFFAGWNKLVTGLTHGFIDLVAISDNSSELSFFNKGDRFFGIMTSGGYDAKLTEFVNVFLVNNCRNYLYYKMMVSNVRDNPVEVRSGLQPKLDRHAKANPSINLNDHMGLKEWALTKLPDEPLLKRDPPILSCDEMWKVGVRFYRKLEVPELVDILIKIHKFEDMPEERQRKLLTDAFSRSTGNTEVISPGDEDAGFDALLSEISARMLFRQLSSIKPHLATLDFTDLPIGRGELSNLYEDTTKTLRYLQATEEYQYKGQLIMGALTMPYIQGLVLFFLAATFPFFALSIIVPGRHTAFLVWMGMWVWVKLWDVGFAVVMMIDNMLYAFLPHGPSFRTDTAEDPALALKLLMHADPGYSSFIYYNLLSCCLFAVPLVTGFLVHKGGSDILESVTNGFKDFPNRFGMSLAGFRRAGQAQMLMGQTRKSTYDAVRDHMFSAGNTDAELRDLTQAIAIMSQKTFENKTLFQILGDSRTADIIKTNKFLSHLQSIDGDKLKGISAAKLAVDLGRYRERLLAKQELNLATIAFKTSRSPENYARAAFAVAMNWNSHDFGEGFVTKQLVDYYSAARSQAVGGMYVPLQPKGR